MAGLRNTIVVQFKTDGRISDWDRLIEIEEALIQGFSQNNQAEVDGHDFGSGTMNIFIFPRAAWGPAIEIVLAYLKLRNALSDALVIKRLKSGKHVVVWPEGFEGEFELT